jgi:hypothetical protein
MICSLNILFNHPVSEATPNSKITGAYSPAYSWTILTGEVLHIIKEQHPLLPHLVLRLLSHLPSLLLDNSHR